MTFHESRLSRMFLPHSFRIDLRQRLFQVKRYRMCCFRGKWSAVGWCNETAFPSPLRSGMLSTSWSLRCLWFSFTFSDYQPTTTELRNALKLHTFIPIYSYVYSCGTSTRQDKSVRLKSVASSASLLFYRTDTGHSFYSKNWHDTKQRLFEIHPLLGAGQAVC